MAGGGGFGPDAPGELRSFRLPWRLRCLCTHTLLAPWVAVHPGASSISMYSGSCIPFRLLRLVGVLVASVPATRICASLRILVRSGLWPPSHPPLPLIPPSHQVVHLRALPAPPSLRCSRVQRRSHFCGRGSGLCLTSSSPIRAPMAWDCSDFGQGEIPASFAGSGDTRGCRPLLGGVVTVVVCAPLRASGETIGPVIRIGRRRRLSVVLLREGVVLVARGVLGSGSGDVGCRVIGLYYFSG